MFAINRTTIRETYENDDRIHNLKVTQEHLDFITEAEKFCEENSPLPITFDVATCQNIYFSEYTYSDFSGAFWIKSLSGEYNSRYMMTLSKEIEGEISFSEKYKLADHPHEEAGDRTILFLAGTNLYDQMSWEIVDRVLYSNETALIKPHPLTQDESLKKLGHRYGWHRVLGPMDSGYYWFDKASEVFTTANSELMVRSMLANTFKDCLTQIEQIPRCSYFPFFTMNLAGYSSNEIKSVILDPASGIVFPTQDDWKDRLKLYFERSREFRTNFKPHTPFFPSKMQ